MIARSDADRLRALRASGPEVISVYLRVPLDVADHRGLPTRARELVKSATSQRTGASGGAWDADLGKITQAITVHSHDWLGHTVAIFACDEIGLFEVAPLPGAFAERAVLGVRPHIRPLLAALQRNPAYHAVVLDTRQAWILAIADDRIETLAERTGTGVPSAGFSGWYGLEAHRIQQRIMRLARQHFRDTIAAMERATDSQRQPIVIGGHGDEVQQFLAILPRGLRQEVAGTFSVDLQTVTPARVRELAAPVIERWAHAAEQSLVGDVLSQATSASIATGLAGCLAAARSHAIGELILADDQVIAGFACDNCGALGTSANACECLEPGPAGPGRAVPDLLDELAHRVLDDGGQVTSVRNPPFAAAARLRFPVTGLAQAPAATR